MATQTRWTNPATSSGWRGMSRAEITAEAPAKPSPQGKSDPCLPPCPDCGGLECYCRPRFFAGQLLTERELNGLQDYVVAKNKLHNRFLVGAGIACGLEATCDPCGDMVRVSPGYAISPCGEDIVVCKPDSVDICALIAKCRETDEPDCRPYAPGKNDCADIIEDWVLTIRYAEGPARDTPPTTSGSCGCGCGGKSSGGCGCGGKGQHSHASGGCGCSSGAASPRTSAKASAEPVLRRGAPPACVPQSTCESYRYDVFRAPDPKPKVAERDEAHPFSGRLEGLEGPMIDRLRCCIREIEDAIPPVPEGNITDLPYRQARARWVCDVRDNFRRFILRRGGHDCSMLDRIMAIPIPPTGDAVAFGVADEAAVKEIIAISFELMVDCLCSALLPSCPEEEDPRIPIAVVKVRRGSCEIVSVCNWTPLRRQLVTWPAMRYWVGWAPLIDTLREILHLMCCEKFGLFDTVRDPVGIKKSSVGMMKAEVPAAAVETAAAVAKPQDQPATTKLGITESLVAKSLEMVMAKRAAGLPIYDAGPMGIPATELLAALAGPRGEKGNALRATAVDRVIGELTRPLREAAPLEFLTTPLGLSVPGTPDIALELAAMRKTIAEQQQRIAALEGGADVKPAPVNAAAKIAAKVAKKSGRAMRRRVK